MTTTATKEFKILTLEERLALTLDESCNYTVELRNYREAQIKEKFAIGTKVSRKNSNLVGEVVSIINYLTVEIKYYNLPDQKYRLPTFEENISELEVGYKPILVDVWGMWPSA